MVLKPPGTGNSRFIVDGFAKKVFLTAARSMVKTTDFSLNFPRDVGLITTFEYHFSEAWTCRLNTPRMMANIDFIFIYLILKRYKWRRKNFVFNFIETRRNLGAQFPFATRLR